jgi:signal transduction histidine kinase
VPVVFSELSIGRLDRTAEITGYFVFAEALTNAQRHAHATTVHVSVFSADGALHVVVADDGVGGAAQWPGSGLEGLRDRVEATGGTFAIADGLSRGTEVSAAIPLAAGGTAK